MRMLCFAAEEAVLPAAFVRCPETVRKAQKRKKKSRWRKNNPN